jgi:type IV secretion system protein VirB10
MALGLIGILSAGTALSYFMSLPEEKSSAAKKAVAEEKPIIDAAAKQPEDQPALPEQFFPKEVEKTAAAEEKIPEQNSSEPEIRVITYGDDKNAMLKEKSAKTENLIATKKTKEKKFLQDPERIIPTTKIIPIILYDEIHSELSSRSVRAQVEQDVVGHTGWNLLIPKGSWVIGRYQPLKKFGDTRLMIGWERLITPEGEDIPFQGAAENSHGAEGMGGRLENRMMERYGIAFLLGTLNAGAQFSLDSEDRNSRALAEALGNSVDDVIEESARQGLQLAPILHIKRGTRLSIQPLADLFFPAGEKLLSDEVSAPLSAPKLSTKEPAITEINDEIF